MIPARDFERPPQIPIPIFLLHHSFFCHPDHFHPFPPFRIFPQPFSNFIACFCFPSVTCWLLVVCALTAMLKFAFSCALFSVFSPHHSALFWLRWVVFAFSYPYNRIQDLDLQCVDVEWVNTASVSSSSDQWWSSVWPIFEASLDGTYSISLKLENDSPFVRPFVGFKT